MTVYLDHSATTPLDPRVLAAMLPYWSDHYGNPSSAHQLGKAAAAALDIARQRLAGVLNCAPDELIFTSGGTESDNLALRGTAYALRERGRGAHIITTAAEHHAVLDMAKALESERFEITILSVNAYGQVTADQVRAALRDDTILVSVLYANNEVGSINPVTEIGQVLKSHRARLMVDAVQAPGLLPLNVQALGVDLLSLSSHKFYGPKGIGLLYKRRVTPLKAQMLGGGQQQHQRSGTEAVPLIVGMAEALALAEQEREATCRTLTALRNHLTQGLMARLPDTLLTGHPSERLAGHASFALRSLNGDAVLLDLDQIGFCASGGSACTTGAQEPSHVLLAMGVHPDYLMGQIRFVLGKSNTASHVDQLLYHLERIIERHTTV